MFIYDGGFNTFGLLTKSLKTILIFVGKRHYMGGGLEKMEKIQSRKIICYSLFTLYMCFILHMFSSKFHNKQLQSFLQFDLIRSLLIPHLDAGCCFGDLFWQSIIIVIALRMAPPLFSGVILSRNTNSIQVINKVIFFHAHSVQLQYISESGWSRILIRAFQQFTCVCLIIVAQRKTKWDLTFSSLLTSSNSLFITWLNKCVRVKFNCQNLITLKVVFLSLTEQNCGPEDSHWHDSISKKEKIWKKKYMVYVRTKSFIMIVVLWFLLHLSLTPSPSDLLPNKSKANVDVFTVYS